MTKLNKNHIYIFLNDNLVENNVTNLLDNFFEMDVLFIPIFL